MSLCPFCKAPVSNSSAPCPRCGKLASHHPSVQGSNTGRELSTDFDDDVPDLDLVDTKGPAAAPAKQAAPSFESQGRTLDDDFADDVSPDLELDVPTGHSSQRSLPAAPPEPPPPPPAQSKKPAPPSASQKPPPSSSGKLPSLASSSQRLPAVEASEPQLAAAPPPPPPPPPKPTPAAIVAKYPLPPEKIWEAPLYAWKVVYRQLELRQDLASLRKRRSPDVPLYEAALKAHDRKTFALGVALTCAGLVVAGFVFCLPMIIRQIGD